MDQKTEYIYEFCYQPCTYESAPATMSIHRSLIGAYTAMKAHRLRVFWDWRKTPNEFRKSFQDNFAQDWFIKKTEIQP